MLMFPLHNLILLWSGNTRMLLSDAICSKEVFHEKFMIIISPKIFDSLIELCVNCIIERLKKRSSFSFRFHQI